MCGPGVGVYIFVVCLQDNVLDKEKSVVMDKTRSRDDINTACCNYEIE
jgi:hypothetical protein